MSWARNWDAEQVKPAILPHLASLAAEWGVKLTGRKSPKGWIECHAIDREDETPSAGIDEKTGVYKDQGGGGGAFSVFDLAVKLGVYRDFSDAVNALGERYGVPAKGSLFAGKAVDSPFIVRATSGPTRSNPKTSKPSKPAARIGKATFEEAVASAGRSPKVQGEYQHHWTYRNADGSEAFRIVRYKTLKGKTYRPVHRSPDAGWLVMDPPGPMPLYDLPDMMSADASLPIFIVEGEKVADLARGIGLAVTTSAHGAKSASNSDWSPLAGREIVIIPDAGQAGEEYKAKVVKLLLQLHPKPSIRILELPGLKESEDLEQWLERVPDNWGPEDCGREIRRLSESAIDPRPTPDVEPDPATIPITNRFDLGVMGMVAFSNATYPREWLIKRIMVKGKPGIIGGPKKSLKTSFVVDLAISLAGAGRFLGQFDVPRPVKTLVISGESGEATIQETMRRICRSKGVYPPDLEGFVFWGFKLPQLSDPEELDTMGEFIKSNGVECVVIDPLYLCLISGGRKVDPANLFDVGPLLKRICDTCLDAGATPLLVHHFRKNRESPFGTPDMEDMAFAGIQEFARQWILIGRRSAYSPGSGEHNMWLSVGGSDGHSGEWSVDITEGIIDEDFRDRGWEVTISSAAEAVEKAKEKIAASKAEKSVENAKARDLASKRKLHDEAEQALSSIFKAPGRRKTKKSIRDELGCSGSKVNQLMDILEKQGRIKLVESMEIAGEDGKIYTSSGYEFVTNNLPEDLF